MDTIIAFLTYALITFLVAQLLMGFVAEIMPGGASRRTVQITTYVASGILVYLFSSVIDKIVVAPLTSLLGKL